MDLDNDRTWTPRHGAETKLEDLTVGHRANLLAWLERNARSLQAGEVLEFLSGTQPNPDSEAGSMVLSGIMSYATMDPEEWLSEQPLVIRLRKLVKQDELSTAGWTRDKHTGALMPWSDEVLDRAKRMRERAEREAEKARRKELDEKRKSRKRAEKLDKAKRYLRRASITTRSALRVRQAEERAELRRRHEVEYEALTGLPPVKTTRACLTCSTSAGECSAAKRRGQGPCCVDCATLDHRHPVR